MVSMNQDREASGRRPRTPRELRRRRRWWIAAAVVAGWVLLEVLAGSATSATVLLVVLVCLGAAAAAGLRALGITRDHPWIRPLASRPWRDGQDVLRIAMAHLSDVFVVTPSGSLLAPSVVGLQLNPGDLRTLCQRMDLGVIRASLAEVYESRRPRTGLASPGQAGPRCTSSRPGRSRRAATSSGRRTR
jgi:hypothetical protein